MVKTPNDFQPTQTDHYNNQEKHLLVTIKIMSTDTTVLPAKSDSDVVFCLQLLSKTLTCTLHLSLYESIYHLCINPILQIG